MHLKMKCKNSSCKKEFKFPSNEILRARIENEVGRYFQHQCPECLSTKEYHVNDIRAYQNKSELLIVVALAIFTGVALTYFLWEQDFISFGSIIIPFTIIGIHQKQTINSITTFNKLKVSKTR